MATEAKRVEPKSKVITMAEGDGMGAVIERAESLGWIDTHGDAQAGTWSPGEADACEEDAIEYITGLGYTLIYGDAIHEPPAAAGKCFFATCELIIRPVFFDGEQFNECPPDQSGAKFGVYCIIPGGLTYHCDDFDTFEAAQRYQNHESTMVTE